MTHLLLSAFYDNVDKNVGPVLIWVFFFLCVIQWIYAMIKYLNSDDSK